MAAFVENHRDMGYVAIDIPFNIPLEHVAKSGNRANWQTVGFARQRGQRVVGAKDEGRAVYQMQVASFVEIGAHEKMPPRLI
jgi:hypothetical protein